jgi:glycerophosphoryl diester phosphodiesterase
MRRRDFLTGIGTAGVCQAIAPDMHLIAHRGGVVDAQRPENSTGSITAAIQRGYWMIEVDVRRTKDGEPILHHDRTLQRYYRDSRRTEDLTWGELKTLRASPGGGSPLHFEQACALGEGKMRLMLDLKGSDWPKEFYGRLLRIMEEQHIPTPVYSLGGARVKPLFDGRVMVSANRKALTAAAEQGESVRHDYFLFELGSDLDQEAVALCRKLQVTPVAAINTFRYTMAKRDETLGPAEDVAKLRRLGVTYYQIDSRYEGLFNGVSG